MEKGLLHARNLQQALRYYVMRLFVLLDDRDPALALPVRVFFADLRVHVVLHILHDHVCVSQGAVVVDDEFAHRLHLRTGLGNQDVFPCSSP